MVKFVSVKKFKDTERHSRGSHDKHSIFRFKSFQNLREILFQSLGVGLQTEKNNMNKNKFFDKVESNEICANFAWKDQGFLLMNNSRQTMENKHKHLSYLVSFGDFFNKGSLRISNVYD